jgi:hypothetical protein
MQLFRTYFWEAQKVFMFVCKMAVKIVRYEWKLKWFDPFFLNSLLLDLIKVELSILELVHEYGGRWSRFTSQQLHMNTPYLFPPRSQTSVMWLPLGKQNIFVSFVVLLQLTEQLIEM